MGAANLSISVVEKRMLRKSEAAEYTGIPAKYFCQTCPCQPLEIRPGSVLWDKRDLDSWIDTMKEDAELTSQDAILSKL